MSSELKTLARQLSYERDSQKRRKIKKQIEKLQEEYWKRKRSKNGMV